MNGFEKLQKLGYKGVNNPLAIHPWLIIEKNILAEVYFNRFHKKWCMNNRWIDTKTGKLNDWDHTNKPFNSYREAIAHVVEVIVKLM